VVQEDRLASLVGSGMLDETQEPALDRWTRLGSSLLSAPICLLSMVDRDRQYFKSQVGLPAEVAQTRETPLSHSFCQHVVAEQGPLVVSDARQDLRVRDNGAVRDLGVIAYAGQPVTTSDGHTLGSFCVIDSKPRSWSAAELALLEDLAVGLTTEIELRVALRRSLAVHDELAANQRQTREILDTAHDAFISMGENGRIVDWNPQAEATFGWSSAEAIGRDLADTISPPVHRAAHRRGMAHYLSTGEGPALMQRLELSALHRDGREFPLELTISAQPAAEGCRFHAFARDVTERRAAERAKDEFTSMVSHELRTPLTSIRGSLGLLESGLLGPLSEKGQRMVEIAVENTDRLVRLINDILDLERVDSGAIDLNPQPCDAAGLIQQAVQGLDQFAAQAQVEIVTEETTAVVLADSDRVIQTLTNLISNAVKFSSAGSTVRLSCAQRDDEVLFKVSDQGRGIPAEKLELIFERFQQVDASDSREKGGTGLGLAICRMIVERHGGRIWVESSPAGSVFSFALPTASNAASSPEGLPGRPSILVCDNDAAVVEVVGKMLEQHGFRAIGAQSGRQALELATIEQPDAILLDLLMPAVSGEKTAAALAKRDETRDIPVVILSVLSASEAGKDAGARFFDWVEKPIDETALFHALERAIRSRPTRSTSSS